MKYWKAILILLLDQDSFMEKVLTLYQKEEMLLAKDLGDYYRICTDDRGLNYDKYFSSGNKRKIVEDYSSNNTKLLNKDEMMDLLKTIPEIKNDLS